MSAAILLSGLPAFCQEVKYGTIYIKHPYIEVVNEATNDFIAGNFSRTYSYYADTTMWWISGLKKIIPIAEAVKRWEGNFVIVKQVPNGYPDYLHYIKNNSMVVQSWWTLTAKSKKTNEVAIIPMAMFDWFNTDGKMTREFIYEDFSKLFADCIRIMK